MKKNPVMILGVCGALGLTLLYFYFNSSTSSTVPPSTLHSTLNSGTTNAHEASWGKLALFVLILLGFVGAVFFTAIWLITRYLGGLHNRRVAANLGPLAERLGLKFVPNQIGDVRETVTYVKGMLRGRPVALYAYLTGGGKSREVWEAVSAQPARDGGLTFALKEWDGSSKVGVLKGQAKVVTGDEAFDAAWFVQSNRPEFFAAALIPELRAKLMAARKGGWAGRYITWGWAGHYKLADGVVEYAERGSFDDAVLCKRFSALVDIVCDLASIAEVAADDSGPAKARKENN